MNKVKSNLSSESLNVVLNILNEIKYGTLTSGNIRCYFRSIDGDK